MLLGTWSRYDPVLNSTFSITCMCPLTYIHTKSADLVVAYSQSEVFALPLKSNKTTGNLRRYDDSLAINNAQGEGIVIPDRHLLVTLILTLNSKICEVSDCQTQSAINAILCHRFFTLSAPALPILRLRSGRFVILVVPSPSYRNTWSGYMDFLLLLRAFENRSSHKKE